MCIIYKYAKCAEFSTLSRDVNISEQMLLHLERDAASK